MRCIAQYHKGHYNNIKPNIYKYMFYILQYTEHIFNIHTDNLNHTVYSSITIYSLQFTLLLGVCDLKSN